MHFFFELVDCASSPVRLRGRCERARLRILPRALADGADVLKCLLVPRDHSWFVVVELWGLREARVLRAFFHSNSCFHAVIENRTDRFSLVSSGEAHAVSHLNHTVIGCRHAVVVPQTSFHCLLHHGAYQVLTAFAQCANVTLTVLQHGLVLTGSDDVFLMQNSLL